MAIIIKSFVWIATKTKAWIFQEDVDCLRGTWVHVKSLGNTALDQQSEIRTQTMNFRSAARGFQAFPVSSSLVQTLVLHVYHVVLTGCFLTQRLYFKTVARLLLPHAT